MEDSFACHISLSMNVGRIPSFVSSCIEGYLTFHSFILVRCLHLSEDIKELNRIIVGKKLYIIRKKFCFTIFENLFANFEC